MLPSFSEERESTAEFRAGRGVCSIREKKKQREAASREVAVIYTVVRKHKSK